MPSSASDDVELFVFEEDSASKQRIAKEKNLSLSPAVSRSTVRSFCASTHRTMDSDHKRRRLEAQRVVLTGAYPSTLQMLSTADQDALRGVEVKDCTERSQRCLLFAYYAHWFTEGEENPEAMETFVTPWISMWLGWIKSRDIDLYWRDFFPVANDLWDALGIHHLDLSDGRRVRLNASCFPDTELPAGLPAVFRFVLRAVRASTPVGWLPPLLATEMALSKKMFGSAPRAFSRSRTLREGTSSKPVFGERPRFLQAAPLPPCIENMHDNATRAEKPSHPDYEQRKLLADIASQMVGDTAYVEAFWKKFFPPGHESVHKEMRSAIASRAKRLDINNCGCGFVIRNTNLCPNTALVTDIEDVGYRARACWNYCHTNYKDRHPDLDYYDGPTNGPVAFMAWAQKRNTSRSTTAMDTDEEDI